MATGFPAGLTATRDGPGWPAAAFFQRGESAENTVTTERESDPRWRRLHHGARETIHQTRHLKFSNRPGLAWRCPSIASPITRSVNGFLTIPK